jgi:hypothetical protein
MQLTAHRRWVTPVNKESHRDRVRVRPGSIVTDREQRRPTSAVTAELARIFHLRAQSLVQPLAFAGR